MLLPLFKIDIMFNFFLKITAARHGQKNNVAICLNVVRINVFFRKLPFSGEDDRGKTSPRALVFTRCDIQSERLLQEKKSFKYIP